MASEFSTEFFSANRIVKADLRAARTPREEDLERIKKEVGKLYDATEVILNVTVDDRLLSGYVPVSYTNLTSSRSGSVRRRMRAVSMPLVPSMQMSRKTT